MHKNSCLTCDELEPETQAILSEQESHREALTRANLSLKNKSAEQRVSWALECLPDTHILSSSFGAQAAVMLRLVTLVKPDIPIIFIDTGYNFTQTYQFVDELVAKLQLNLQVYRAKTSPAWQEARHGERWNMGTKGIKQYNAQNKVEPMERALKELNVGTWFAGLRRTQDKVRAQRAIVEGAITRYKVHPIVDWTDRDVYRFLRQHDLPYHPLRDEGYISIGDWHSTKSLNEVDDVSKLRFQGLVRECGINTIDLAGVDR